MALLNIIDHMGCRHPFYLMMVCTEVHSLSDPLRMPQINLRLDIDRDGPPVHCVTSDWMLAEILSSGFEFGSNL